MADEAIVTVSLQFKKGNVDLTLSDAAKKFDVTGTRYMRTVQNVGTSEEALDMGDITDPGWAYFRNLDSSNYVEIAQATGANAFLRINAGESCCFRLIATAPFVTANSSAVDLEYMIVQN